MRVAPSAMASAKSPLMPIESTSNQSRMRIRPAVAPVRASCGSRPASHPPARPTAQSSSGRAFRDGESPASPRAAAASSDSGSSPAFVSSGLSFTSISTGSRLPFARRFVQPLGQAQRIQRIDAVKKLRRARRLVRLQMADQMNAQLARSARPARAACAFCHQTPARDSRQRA
jgi:hypothetical protein